MDSHDDWLDARPLTSLDVTLSVGLLVAALGSARPESWSNRAGTLEWDCWETIEHVADSLFAYATQLTSATPEGGYVPIAMTSTGTSGARSAIHVDRDSGPIGLLQMLRACGDMLVAMLTSVPADTRAWHPYGTSDLEGFAAMGVTETLVHGHDVAQGFGEPWNPPDELCARVLNRLFPGAPTDIRPWTALLWATGRAEVLGRPGLTDWRWHSEPRQLTQRTDRTT
jgi:hypothetical protein